MADRELLEQNRALAQRITAMETEIRALRLRASWTTAPRVKIMEPLSASQFAKIYQLADMNLDPGRWLILAQATLMFSYAGTASPGDWMGDTLAELQIQVRTPEGDLVEVPAHTRWSPMATPLPYSSFGLPVDLYHNPYQPMMVGADVSSEDGMNISMSGYITNYAGSVGTSFTWDPGLLMAFPL